MMRRLPLFLLCAIGAAGCSSPFVARVAPSVATGALPFFALVAEGLTAPSLTEPMRVAPRMFSALQLTAVCQTPRRIGRLEAPARTVELRVGDRLTLSSLNIVAISDANVAVTDVPVAFDVEERTPPIVSLRSDDPDLNAGRLLTLAEGRFRVRVRTICVNDPAEVMINGRVLP
jgi:hypothetical protein